MYKSSHSDKVKLHSVLVLCVAHRLRLAGYRRRGLINIKPSFEILRCVRKSMSKGSPFALQLPLRRPCTRPNYNLTLQIGGDRGIYSFIYKMND